MTHDTSGGERFAVSSGHTYSGHTIYGERAHGASTGSITTVGRANRATRQEVADAMATVTETAVVGAREIQDGRPVYPVIFTVTHRIVPIEGDPRDYENA